MKEIAPFQKGKIRDAIVNSLIDTPLFEKLDHSELEFIASHMNIFKLVDGDTVFKEGDNGDFVCFIVNGKLDVVKKSGEGAEVVLAQLSRGRSIGEMSIVDDFPRSATVRACTSTTLVTLTRRRFEFILENYPPIGIKVLKGITRLMSLYLRKASIQLSGLGPLHG